MEKEYCSIFNPHKLDECITCEKGYYYLEDEYDKKCGDNYYNEINSLNNAHCNNGTYKECYNDEVCKKCYDKKFVKKKFVERNGEYVKCLIFINVKLSKNKLLLINLISLYLKYIYNKFL